MVIQSNIDYERHKQEVHEKIKARYGTQRADTFTKFYKNRYDRWGRSFIDYRLAFTLIDDYYQVRKLGTICYGIVGTKGQGKSTLMKNIMYWLHPYTTHKYITDKITKAIDMLDSFPPVDARRPVGLDEPDGGYHFSSKEGMALRRVVGAWRQQQIYFLMCATDMANIPPYIYRDLDVLIFVPYHGIAYVFRNKPRLRQYIVQDIKREYNKRGTGYGVFFEIAKKKPSGFLKINTHQTSPLDLKEGKAYLTSKARGYKEDIKYAKRLLDEQNKFTKPEKESERVKIVEHMRKQGKSLREIGDLVGVSKQAIHYTLKKASKVKKAALIYKK